MDTHGFNELEAMRMGVDYTFPIKLRGFSLQMRPLSNAEMIESYGAVSDYLSKLPASYRSKVAEDNALAREFLKKASSPFGTYAPKLTDLMLDAMTTDEVMFLYREWLNVCDRVNPSLERIPQERLQALVEEVKKNPPEDLFVALTELSSGQLRNLAAYLLTKGD